MGGRPYFLLYNPAVSSYTKDKSSTASGFRKKCPTGTKSSMVIMWYFNCTVDPPCFSLFYHIFNQIMQKIFSHFFVYVTQILIDLQALFSDAIMAPSHRARC